MRKIIFGLFLSISMMPTLALADPTKDTNQLYNVVVLRSMVLIKLLEKDIDQPIAFADVINSEVTEYLSKAQQAWWDTRRQYNNPESYDMYEPCINAAYNLEQVANKIQRYLRRLDKEPIGEKHLQPFRDELSLCEKALGLPITFDAQLK